MKSFIAALALIFIYHSVVAQDKGTVALGLRNTVSTFHAGDKKISGSGAGGHFRIMLSDRINTEWFADYFLSGKNNPIHREDAHIGWSVMFYPVKMNESTQLLMPFLLAGHCFDYTKIKESTDYSNFSERWSSAVQMGAGIHMNFTEKTDVSLSAQYMAHLGNDIDTHISDNKVTFIQHRNTNLEGHLLLTLSVNVKTFRIWGKK